jgi:hypothetical protein
MEWRFNLKMEINKFLKIGLFIVATSVLFSACANKSMNKVSKSSEKPKVKTINEVLNNASLFEYDASQKIYKNKSTNEESRNNLLLELGNLCSQKNGKIVYVNTYINKTYINSYSNNKAYVCEVNNEAYFIGHMANLNSNSYYSVSIDENIKKMYLSNKNDAQFESSFESTKPSVEDTQNSIKERDEIQKREKAREQKTKLLFGNKNQKTMTFFESWKSTESKALCATKCTSINKQSTGYSTLKDATNSNWQLVSKMGETDEVIDDSCTCSGYSVILKKL